MAVQGLSPCQTLSLVGCSPRSAGVTPLLRYYGPIRHPLAFERLPGWAGYTIYLAPVIFDGTMVVPSEYLEIVITKR